MSEVLITGGSEGIGRAFAQYFARREYNLILVARNMPKLIDVKADLEGRYHTRVTLIPMDLSEKNAADRLYEKIRDTEIDVFVNNAGCGVTGRSWQIPVEQEENMLSLNVIAMTSLCKHVLGDQLKRGRGLIINVSSTGAFQPGPYIAGYYASKAYVLSYTRAVHEEVKNSGVQVCALCPGPTDTAFYQKSGGKMSRFHMTPDKVVRYCMKHTRKTVIVPGFTNRLVCLIPVRIRVFFLKRMKKK